MGRALLAGVLAIALTPTPALAEANPTARASQSSDSTSAAASVASEASNAIDDELIVTYRSGKNIGDIVEDSDVDADSTEKLASSMDGRNISLVKLDDGQDSDKAIADLEDDPRVESVEHNRTFHLLQSVDDPYASNSYYLDTENIASAWDYAKTEGAVSVAVLDSGVTMASSYRDPDLENTVDFAHAYDAINNRKLSASFVDRLGHGTSVASLIAAEANNNRGIAGTSYNANIVPVRVTDSQGEADTDTVIRAYEHILEVADQLHIKVVNLSLGGEAGYGDDALQACITSAYNRGILTVASAGNEADEGNPVEYPAALQHVVSVGAVDSNGAVADFSERNKHVDLTAAGVEICVPEFWRTEDNDDNDSPSNGWPWYFWSAGFSAKSSRLKATTYEYVPDAYVYGDGTSFSAPIVSGIAALLYAHAPSASARDVEEALERSAVDHGATGRDSSYGYGEVDALAALNRVASVATQNRTFRTSATRLTGKASGKSKIKLRWTSVASSNGYRIEYRVKGKKTWKKASASSSTTAKTLSLKRKTAYQIRVRAYQKGWNDTGRQWSKYSKTVAVKTK